MEYSFILFYLCVYIIPIYYIGKLKFEKEEEDIQAILYIYIVNVIIIKIVNG